MAGLVTRFSGAGLLAGLLGKLEDGPAGLEKALTVPGGRGGAALLGGGRAGVIAVNVALPFAYSLGRWQDCTGLRRKAMALYLGYPRLESNNPERHMIRQLGPGKNVVNSACRQQGLLYIFKGFCSQGRCDACPVITARRSR